MKRTYLLFLAALCAVGMSAQMRIWNNGQKIFEFNLSMIDSITFVKSGEPVNPDTSSTGGGGSDTTQTSYTFDHDHWRDVKAVYIYNNKYGRWDSINLPWEHAVATTMPKNYRFPNEEDKWELAFNLLSDPKLLGVHMFGLWDSKASIMRIYSYVEEQANPNANYCYFMVRSEDGATFIERDAMGWMPSDSIINAGNWNEQALANVAPVPSDEWCQVMPITGTLGGQVNQGWLCFELNFSAGNFTLPLHSSISFALYGQQKIDASGTLEINEYMKTDSGSVTIPGNKTRRAAGILKAIGSLATTVGEGISSGFGKDKNGATIGGGITQMAGAAFSFIGDMMNAVEEGKDKKYAINLNFHTTGTDQIQATLTSTESTSFTGVSMDYTTFFGEILKQQQVNPDSNNLFTIGTWNLKTQPVLYVCNDAGFSTDLYDYNCLLASFLDPSSIAIELNKDTFLFDGNEIDTISLIAYDFAFVSDEYTMTNQPYYDFYGIPRDQLDFVNVRNMLLYLGDDGYKKLLLDSTAEYQAFNGDALDDNAHNIYAGVASQLPSEYEMDAYNVAYSPAIGQYVDYNFFDNNAGGSLIDYLIQVYSKQLSNPLRKIGVSVLLEIKFKNGEQRIFAERFLPIIRTFSYKDAQTIKNNLLKKDKQTSYENVPFKMPVYDMQQQKALRVLDLLIEKNQLFKYVRFGQCDYGLRVRAYNPDDSTPGIVIATKSSSSYFIAAQAYKQSVLTSLHNYLDSLNEWDKINGLLQSYGCNNTNAWYMCKEKSLLSSSSWKEVHYNIQTGNELSTTGMAHNIMIYLEDANGNLTQLGYDADSLW